MKPLIWKELRENVRWMPIGLLVVTVICWMVYPDQNNRHQLLATTLLTQLAIVTPLLAFAMGVIQTYRDIQPAAGAYLTHRGVTKSERFWAKVISGFVLYMTAISVPLLLFAAWIGYQGVWWFPMRPAQVIPSLVFAFGAFALHPAAMLMMVRSASWWGTRLFPIVPVALVLMPFWEKLSRGGLQGAAWCLFFAAFVLGWIILTARQGWCDLATDPPTANVSRSVFKRWLLPTHLLLGTVLCYVSAVVFSIGFIENASRPRVYVPSPFVQLATEEGTENVWLVTLLQEYNTGLSNYSQTTLGGEQIQPDSQISAISEDAVGKEVKPLDMFVTKSGYYWSGDGFFTSPHNVANLSFVYDFRGYVLVYEGFPQIGWVKTISADGAHPPGELTGTPFQSNPLGSGAYAFSTLLNQNYPLPYIGDQGVFFIDRSPIELRQIINLHVEGAGTVQTSENAPPRIILQSQNKLHEYRLLDESESEDWYRPESKGRERPSVVNLELHADLVRTFTIPQELEGEPPYQIGLTPESLILAKVPRVWNDLVIYRLHPDGTHDAIAFSVAPESIPNADIDEFEFLQLILGLMPGLFFAVLATALAWMIVTKQPGGADAWNSILTHPIESSTTAITFVAVTLLAIWLVRNAAYRRGLSDRQTRFWTWMALLFGMATPLALLAIYRRVYREVCPTCQVLRRVDYPQCEHCDADWPKPSDQGIEILDHLPAPHSESVVATHT